MLTSSPSDCCVDYCQSAELTAAAWRTVRCLSPRLTVRLEYRGPADSSLTSSPAEAQVQEVAYCSPWTPVNYSELLDIGDRYGASTHCLRHSEFAALPTGQGHSVIGLTSPYWPWSDAVRDCDDSSSENASPPQRSSYSPRKVDFTRRPQVHIGAVSLRGEDWLCAGSPCYIAVTK